MKVQLFHWSAQLKLGWSTSRIIWYVAIKVRVNWCMKWTFFHQERRSYRSGSIGRFAPLLGGEEIAFSAGLHLDPVLCVYHSPAGVEPHDPRSRFGILLLSGNNSCEKNSQDSSTTRLQGSIREKPIIGHEQVDYLTSAQSTPLSLSHCFGTSVDIRDCGWHTRCRWIPELSELTSRF